jgi:hypothetical protein
MVAQHNWHDANACHMQHGQCITFVTESASASTVGGAGALKSTFCETEHVERVSIIQVQ